MLFSVLTKRARSQGSSSKVQVLAKKRGSLQGPVTLPGRGHPAPSLHPPASAEAQLKRQISVAGSLRARSPDPTQPSSLREPGAQDPAGPQASRVAQMQAGLHGLRPMETATTIRSQSWGWGRGSLLLQGLGPARGLLWPGLRSPAGHSLPPVPGVPQLARQPEARGPGGARGEPRSASHHTVCHEDPCKADSWQRGTSNCCTRVPAPITPPHSLAERGEEAAEEKYEASRGDS
ncbi:collagen alpha-1(XXVIII) chain-like [Monodon monoceros]|uniref:collagen alpha-1(XXVIII) chain-like n=1 Tax=Monodon monoceros TaxID=40151 RepID=UPI0010F93253|nr:collagen alpha-1(XXVIII) chain-like [Monodon monoceros]